MDPDGGLERSAERVVRRRPLEAGEPAAGVRRASLRDWLVNEGAVRRDEPKELVLRPLLTAADAGSDGTMASRHAAGASSSSRVGVPTVEPVAVRESSSSAAGTGGTPAGSGPGTSL